MGIITEEIQAKIGPFDQFIAAWFRAESRLVLLVTMFDGGIVRQTTMAMGQRKRITLVAHDNKKRDLLEWARFNRVLLAHHELYATGTTGLLIEQELGLEITKLRSGPLGGDQQVGAKVS